MSGLALWGANEISQMIFGQRSIPPASYYLALIRNSQPNAFTDGTELDEPPTDTTGYARLELPNDSTIWDTDGYYLVRNIVDLTFLEATADWGRINYWALCNSVVEGFVYFTGKMPQSEIVNSGDIVHIPAGSLQIALGPIFGVDNGG
jgi:hypothetical protein